MTQTQEPARSRTFTWADPAANAAQVGRRSGIDMLRR